MSRARRHFLGVVAAASARVAAIGLLASTGLTSSAQAKNNDGPSGGGSSPDGGATGGQFPGGGATGGQFPGGGATGGQFPGNGGPRCFLRGTAILTPRGEVPVEELRIGDLVETIRGAALPIRWIGRRVFKKGGAAWPESVMPIRVARRAIDEHTPQRDLYLSPTHALFLEGILIPVKELVNGTSIAPALPDNQEEIEYFHILLDSHEAILAEGAPAETFQPSAFDHEGFSNFFEYERLYPNTAWPVLAPLATVVSYNGRRHLKALLHLGMSRFVGLQDPVEDTYERLAARARDMVKEGQFRATVVQTSPYFAAVK